MASKPSTADVQVSNSGNLDVAYGYVRLSRDDFTDPSFSPSAQRLQIMQYCQMKHLRLVKLYEDVNVSGGIPLADREGGKAMLLALESQSGFVVAVRQDRLFRDSIDALITIRAWLEDGITPVCIAEGLDLSTPAGRLMFTFLAGMAQYEREVTGMRTRDVLAAKREAGKRYSGQVPYGWDDDGAGNLVENISEQCHLKWMRGVRTRGWSDGKIAKQLNAEGIPSKTGGTWIRSSVKSVLEGTKPPRSKKDGTAPLRCIPGTDIEIPGFQFSEDPPTPNDNPEDGE